MSEPVRGLVRPIQGEAETRFSARTLRWTKLEARADSWFPAGPRPVVIQRPILPLGFIEGALKRIVSAVGHRHAIRTNGSTRRGPPVAGGPLG
jgi:hypothetical protein